MLKFVFLKNEVSFSKRLFHVNFVKKDKFILSGTSIFKKQLGGKTVWAHIKPTLETYNFIIVCYTLLSVHIYP